MLVIGGRGFGRGAGGEYAGRGTASGNVGEEVNTKNGHYDLVVNAEKEVGGVGGTPAGDYGAGEFWLGGEGGKGIHLEGFGVNGYHLRGASSGRKGWWGTGEALKGGVGIRMG